MVGAKHKATPGCADHAKRRAPHPGCLLDFELAKKAQSVEHRPSRRRALKLNGAQECGHEPTDQAVSSEQPLVVATIICRAGQLADPRGGSRELVARNVGKHLGAKVTLGLGLVQQDQAGLA